MGHCAPDGAVGSIFLKISLNHPFRIDGLFKMMHGLLKRLITLDAVKIVHTLQKGNPLVPGMDQIFHPLGDAHFIVDQHTGQFVPGHRFIQKNIGNLFAFQHAYILIQQIFVEDDSAVNIGGKYRGSQAPAGIGIADMHQHGKSCIAAGGIHFLNQTGIKRRVKIGQEKTDIVCFPLFHQFCIQIGYII